MLFLVEKGLHSQLPQSSIVIKNSQRQVIQLVVIQEPMDKLSQPNGNFPVHLSMHLK